MNAVPPPPASTELHLTLCERNFHPVPVSGPAMNVNPTSKRPLMAQWETRCLDATREKIVRIRNVEGTIGNHRSDIAGRSSKIDAQQVAFASASKTNRSLLASFFGVIIVVFGVLGSIAKSPIDAALIQLDADVRQANCYIVPRAEVDSQVAILNRDIRDLVEHSEMLASKTEVETTGKRRDKLQRYTNGRIDRIMGQLKKFRQSVVPRGKHQQVWQQEEQAIGRLQRQLDDIKKAFGDTFSLRDALVQMQKRINAQEGQKALIN